VSPTRTKTKKCHLESGLHQRGEDARDFFAKQMAVVPRSAASAGGVARSRVCRPLTYVCVCVRVEWAAYNGAPLAKTGDLETAAHEPCRERQSQQTATHRPHVPHHCSHRLPVMRHLSHSPYFLHYFLHCRRSLLAPNAAALA
jgi:hypothetical protein